MKTYVIPDTRDMRFCEFLIVRPDGIDVYNTTGMNDCPLKLLETLDLEQIRIAFDADKVELNGPKYWMMDEQELEFGGTQVFGGIEARWAAKLDPSIMAKAEQGTAPYTVFNPRKKQRMIYRKGKRVFEIVDADEYVYVLQAHGKDQTMDTLPALGKRLLQLPAGWRYRSRILDDDLVLDLDPDRLIYAIGDEFHQYYTRI